MTSSACAYTYYLYIRAACLITVRSLSKIEFFSLANGIFSESECKGTTFLRTGKIFHKLFSGNLRKNRDKSRISPHICLERVKNCLKNYIFLNLITRLANCPLRLASMPVSIRNLPLKLLPSNERAPLSVPSNSFKT